MLKKALLTVTALSSSAALAADYLKEPDIEAIVSKLATPPERESRRDKSDLNTLLAIPDKRTEKDCERARHEDDISLEHFKKIAPKLFSSEKISNDIEDLIYGAGQDIQAVISSAKLKWKRKRPWERSPKVQLCPGFPRPYDTSYPSGHAAFYKVFGDLLARLTADASEKSAILGFANQGGDDRVVACVHYPSDVEAGKTLGDLIAEHLLMNPEFAKKMKDIEIRAQKLYPTPGSTPNPAHR